MSIQENKEIVRRCIVAFNAQDLEALGKVIAPSFQQAAYDGIAGGQRTFPGHHIEITGKRSSAEEYTKTVHMSNPAYGNSLLNPASICGIIGSQ